MVLPVSKTAPHRPVNGWLIGMMSGALLAVAGCTSAPDDDAEPETTATQTAPVGAETLVIEADAVRPSAPQALPQTPSQTLPQELPARRYGYPYKIGNPYKIAGITYTPAAQPEYDETGIASWYGPKFHGKNTANGETYDMNAMTAAHRTLPMPSWVQVTNLDNRKRAIVRVNDRGPFAKNRILDLSRAAANKLGIVGPGTARVRVQLVPPPQLAAQKRQKQTQSYAQPLVSGGTYFVQIGAFGNRNNARMAADAAAHISPVQLIEANQRGKTLYRVWLGPMDSQQKAAQTLALARAEGYANAHITAQKSSPSGY